MLRPPHNHLLPSATAQSPVAYLDKNSLQKTAALARLLLDFDLRPHALLFVSQAEVLINSCDLELISEGIAGTHVAGVEFLRTRRHADPTWLRRLRWISGDGVNGLSFVDPFYGLANLDFRMIGTKHRGLVVDLVGEDLVLCASNRREAQTVRQ